MLNVHVCIALHAPIRGLNTLTRIYAPLHTRTDSNAKLKTCYKLFVFMENSINFLFDSVAFVVGSIQFLSVHTPVQFVLDLFQTKLLVALRVLRNQIYESK